jgi:signal peptidase I
MPVKILGESMLPTYRNGTFHFLNRLAYWSQPPKAGDVVGLRSPDGDIYIKRVIALPGQTITFRRGKVLVDGKPLDEPYAAGAVPRMALDNAIHLGSDIYYVMGDNRKVSVFGSVTRQRILGKIVSF